MESQHNQPAVAKPDRVYQIALIVCICSIFYFQLWLA